MRQLTMRAGKAPIIVLLGCGLVSMVLGVFVGTFVGKRAHAGTAHKAGSHKGRKGSEPVEVATVFPLGELVVNLADVSSMRYAKMSVALGFKEKVAEEKLKERQAVLRDAVIGVMSRKRFDDVHRKGGLPKLKQEIMVETGRCVPDATVTQVYFENFAMQ